MLFNNNNLSNCKNQINVFNAFRKLWEQHVFWTRTFIISTASNTEDLELVTERLLRNPTDFAVVLRNFYSADKAVTFEGLLKDHLLIAARLINNTKNGNMEAVYEDRKNGIKMQMKSLYFLAKSIHTGLPDNFGHYSMNILK